jgi:hypothetical protein
MLRCRALLPNPDIYATVTVAIRYARRRSLRLSGQLLLPAALGLLLASAPAIYGQSGTPENTTTPAASSDAICTIPATDNQHSLATKSDSTSTTAEEQTASQPGSESSKRPVALPGVQGQTSEVAAEDAQCKRETKDATTTWQPKDPAVKVDQPVLPAADPTAPVLSFSDGKLTVTGNGARLGQILEAIKKLTGISLDIPASGADEQIFDNVGPAPPREVLERLLNGSNLNYVILSSSENPQQIQQLILTARTEAPPTTPGPGTGAVAEQATGPALYGGAGFNNEASGESAPPVAPEPAVAVGNGNPVNANVQQAANASGKTVGQILDELQKKQLQQLDDQAAQAGPQQ